MSRTEARPGQAPGPVGAFAVLGVPIDCLGRPGGTELSPAALRDAGLVERLAAADLGDLPVRIDSPVRDPESGIVGYHSVLNTTRVLRRRLAEVLRRGDRPILAGGCCTQMMGAMAAARDVFGRAGVVWADGHLDLYDGRTSPTGEAADVPLAVALGHGPPGLLEAVGPGPAAAVEDAVLLGDRDRHEAAARGSLLPKDLGPGFLHFDRSAIGRLGAAEAGRRAVERLETRGTRFWIHLDLDVLDRDAFPATDYLMPGGLEWDELIALLRPAGASPLLLGAAIACYNPSRDPGGGHGRRLVEALAVILGRDGVRV